MNRENKNISNCSKILHFPKVMDTVNSMTRGLSCYVIKWHQSIGMFQALIALMLESAGKIFLSQTLEHFKRCNVLELVMNLLSHSTLRWSQNHRAAKQQSWISEQRMLHSASSGATHTKS